MSATQNNPDSWGPERVRFASLQALLGFTGPEMDGLPGPKTKAAFEAMEERVRAELRNKVIRASGWPFAVVISGEDLVIEGTTATWFGGDHDPDDNGETASGVMTKGNRGVMGCALPVIPGVSSTATSPLLFGKTGKAPSIPWKTQVEVTWGGRRIQIPLIDNGPARWVQNTAPGGKAIDLTPAAMAALSGKGRKPNGNPETGSLSPVRVRIIGAAKYAHA